jgi:hypothetical protein
LTVVTRLSILGYLNVDSLLARGTTNTKRDARLGIYFLFLGRLVLSRRPSLSPHALHPSTSQASRVSTGVCLQSLCPLSELAPRTVRSKYNRCVARRTASVRKRLRADGRSQVVFLSHVAPPGALRAHRVCFLISFVFSLRWDFCNFR